MNQAQMLPCVVCLPKGSSDTEPWAVLLAALNAVGLRWQSPDEDAAEYPPQALLDLGNERLASKLWRKWDIPVARRARVILEPEATSPQTYRRESWERYGVRFAASPRWASQLDAYEIAWPYEFPASTGKSVTPTRPFGVSLLAADKRSASRKSLYGFRRECIHLLDECGDGLVVAGPGWGDVQAVRIRRGLKAVGKSVRARQWPNFSEAFALSSVRPANYLGVVRDKESAFQLAPVTLVIENSPDYVSEKLFDAICAGIVPVYVGLNLSEVSLPSSIAISVESEASHVQARLRALGADEIVNVRDAGARWLQSDQAGRFSHLNVWRTVAEKLQQCWLSQPMTMS